jgi:hypothetical protein
MWRRWPEAGIQPKFEARSWDNLRAQEPRAITVRQLLSNVYGGSEETLKEIAVELGVSGATLSLAKVGRASDSSTSKVIDQLRLRFKSDFVI